MRLLEACAYAGTGNVLKVQSMFQACGEHITENADAEHQQAVAERFRLDAIVDILRVSAGRVLRRVHDGVLRKGVEHDLVGVSGSKIRSKNGRKRTSFQNLRIWYKNGSKK